MGAGRIFRAARAAAAPAFRAGAVVLVCALAACEVGSASARESRALAAALESLPGVAPRLSVASRYRPCTEQAPPDGTVVRAECPARRANRKPQAAITRALPPGDDPEAVHARALVDLVVPDERGKALDRAISSLRQLEALTDRPAPVLADLSAALIVRAERTHAPRDLLEAYETAEQALKREPRNLAALYNRALALDRFGLVDETARDWRAYLAVDSTSGWADDARRRVRTLLALRPPPRPAPDAPLAEYERYAAADPQGARELGMDVLLAEWGQAIESGDPVRAEDRLARAAGLGFALERRPGGDASLGDMVRAIQASQSTPATVGELAMAHREYGAGRAAFEELDYARAHALLAAPSRAPGASPALRGWALVHLGIAQVQSGASLHGQQMLREAASAPPERYPALAARALWALGRIIGQNDQYEPAFEQTRQSARLFGRAGEGENEGAALNLLAGIRFVLGEPDSAYAEMHQALEKLKPNRASLRLNNLLISSADEIAKDGLHRSANRILGEAVGVGGRTGKPVIAAEAQLRRARHLAGIGELPAAEAELRAGQGVAQNIQDPPARQWIAADLRETHAVLSLRTDPVGATSALDSAAAFFTRLELPFRTLPALVGSADARLTAGDVTGAVVRLERALGLLDRRRDAIRVEPRRAAVFDAARAVVDRIVLLKLAEGKPDEALRYIDGARASLAVASGGSAGSDGTIAPLEGETAVEYALIADTLLIWTVSARGVDVFRSTLDTVRFAQTLRHLENELQRAAPEAEVRPALALLYDWLVRPVASRLASGSGLVVVADGDIAAVPFAALYDARRGRYLVEEHPFRFAVSLRNAHRRPRLSASAVLLVADPAFDAREHPLLDPLEHARAEVREVTGYYPQAATLTGREATPAAFASAMIRSDVVHFAGHAVFDDQRPERSYLVLARPVGQHGPGRISAADLSRLDLRAVRLVVLSACRTVRAGRGRAGGFTGLSGALLAAGAGGTVGSTWNVDDRLTAALLSEFHRAYRKHGDGPRALQQAQLALFRSDGAAFQTPAAWAAFRYAGR